MKQPHKTLGFSRLFVIVALVLSFAQGDALAAGAQAWTLQDSAGQVRLVKSGISPIALTTGDVFAGGDWIETGPDGRAVLMRGDERIVVAPNSRIGLPRENSGPFATRILHTLGTILLTVEKKASQHFVVETPYLAAVVKGTTFTVGIQGQRAVVHVVEGLVEVRDLASGQRDLVRPGQTASVLSGGRPGVSVEGGNRGAQAPAHPGPTDAVAIRQALGPANVDLTNSTGGLMREANASPNAPNPGAAAVNPEVRGNSFAARAEHGQPANAGGAAVSGGGNAQVAMNERATTATAAGLSGPSIAVDLLVGPPGLSELSAQSVSLRLDYGVGPLNNTGHGPLDNPGKGKRKK